MLSKGSRLSKHEVEYVLKRGKRFSSRYFSATALLADSSPSRFAAVVSKKTANTAVERNNLRRRTYNAVRATLPSDSPARSIHAVIVVKKEAKLALYAALVKDMGQLMRVAAGLK